MKAGVDFETGHRVLLVVEGARSDPALRGKWWTEGSSSRKPAAPDDAAKKGTTEKAAAGDPDAKRPGGPLKASSATWSLDAAAIGDEVELTAEVSGDDTSPLEFRIADADNTIVAKLAPTVKGTQARVVWKVPASAHANALYDFGCWNKATVLKRSGKLAVADVIHVQVIDPHSGEKLAGHHYRITLHDGSVREGVVDAEGYVREEKVPPGEYSIALVDGEHEPVVLEDAEMNVGLATDRPRLHGGPGAPAPKQAEPIHVAGITVRPARAFEGDMVTLRAHVLGSAEGAKVAFHVHRGAALEATVDGTVEGGYASAGWKVAGAQGGGEEHGHDFADFSVDAVCRGSTARTTSATGLRAYRRKG